MVLKTRRRNRADLALSQCWATNVMCHLQLMQAAGPVFEKNADGGVYLISSSVAVCPVSPFGPGVDGRVMANLLGHIVRR